MSSTAIRTIETTSLAVIISPEPTTKKKKSSSILRAPTKGIRLRDKAQLESSMRFLDDKLSDKDTLIVQTIKNNRGLCAIEYARMLAAESNDSIGSWQARISRVLNTTQQGKRLVAYGVVALAPVGRSSHWFGKLPKSYKKRVAVREIGTQIGDLTFNGPVNDDIKRDYTEARQSYLAALGRRWISSSRLDDIARGDAILAYQAVNASQAQNEMANLERRISLLGREMDKVGDAIVEISGLNGLIRKVSGLVAHTAR